MRVGTMPKSPVRQVKPTSAPARADVKTMAIDPDVCEIIAPYHINGNRDQFETITKR